MFKMLYLSVVKYLPEKYIEVMNLLSNREIRINLPVQELNILLEPLIRAEDEIQVNEAEVISFNSVTDSNDEESNSSEQESSDNSLVEIDEDESSSDYSNKSFD
jgi:hypothetical protein